MQLWVSIFYIYWKLKKMISSLIFLISSQEQKEFMVYYTNTNNRFNLDAFAH